CAAGPSVSDAKAPFLPPACARRSVSGISTGFPVLSRSDRQVAYVLLTRPPLGIRASTRRFPPASPHDLHVLGAPPAFVLSQDQPLHECHEKIDTDSSSGLLHCAVFKEHHANAVHVLCFASMLCVACIAAASLFERD